MVGNDKDGAGHPSKPAHKTLEHPQHDTHAGAGQIISLEEKAAQFLRHDGVRDAPKEEKETFLRSKGFSTKEIDELFKKDSKSSQALPDARDDSGSDTANAPPIITYPEFLLHSQKPLPLVTVQSLLTTAYVVSGIAATVCGTSKYLVAPMLESLSSSRHSLLDTACMDLRALNEKLGSNVSAVPSHVKTQKELQQSEPDSTSDGAHCFFRTVATQTTPDMSCSPKTADIESALPSSLAGQQAAKLEELRRSLEAIKPANASDRSVQESIEELRGFLSKLPHSTNLALVSKTSSSSQDNTTQDGVARMKGEIKGVKGVLLSARNFPSSTVR